jgi:phosphoenolpyruvate carboxykinase (ATP)
MLGNKMQEHNVNVWLINTGWSGGVYGVGKRISLKYTRAMITAILNGELEDAEYNTHEVFGLQMPTACPNVPSEILSPKNTWTDKDAYNSKANELADAFNKNFTQFAENANDEILDAAPKSTVKN